MSLKHMIKMLGLVMLFCLTSLVMAGPDKKIEKSFEAKKKVKIKLALSDCVLKSSTDNKIHASVSYTYSDDEYEVVFRESGNSVTMQEKFPGDDARGSAEWVVSVPKDIKVDVNSGTGDLILSASQTEIDGNTGTGDIELTDASGEFELNSGTGSLDIQTSEGDFDLNSGTGKVRIKNCKGNFNANSGTGSVEAQKITFTEEGEFNSGTGDVEVIEPTGDDYELTLNSGTGDAVLDFNGAELSGYFEFKAGLDRGRIKADLDFDRVEEHGYNGNGTLVKSVKIKSDTPRFYISTGNGTAELIK
jgi:hypothetical protein